MTKFTIPAGTTATITIPAKNEPVKTIERTGFSIDETAESLGVSVDTIRALTKNGTLRTIRIGRRVIVSVRSLREFVDGKTETTDKTHVGK